MAHPARPGASIPAVILSLSLLTACGGPASQPQPSPSNASPSSAAATATESTTAAASPSAPGTSPATPPPSASSWTTYTTAAGDLSFDLPSTWNIKDPAGELAEGGGAFAEVTSEDGRLLATLRTNMATGSTCTEKYPYSVIESQDLPQLKQDDRMPRYTFETRGNTDIPGPPETPAAAYGITIAAPPEGDTTCYIFHFFTWPPNAAMFGGFYNPELNLTPGDPSLPYLEKAKLYAQTPEYRDIKRMITSLRPAG
ncbi:hypothetical protein Asphe3_35190 [Pseudarthrobacter phenanthrenivorans Sphe3]|uniref:Lipoprotein n=1 Tax=Pseudarthrobacter phenanthrenivorans (strain DSM 18606 / JCM 16027 / LMG 23796 / Sphe3) TaxID=930171 RepID=F0M5A0_PSEPM|nr:hypothetical protein [Pseudarthrobacter phenanthrenivorans]ADX74620.1 hypothetical protein Asphe3_35190 [Pseudarthrobacter phenanthrenivorans Sphe3]